MTTETDPPPPADERGTLLLDRKVNVRARLILGLLLVLPWAAFLLHRQTELGVWKTLVFSGACFAIFIALTVVQIMRSKSQR